MNEYLQARLRKAEVPANAIATTLPLMGHGELRDLITKGSLGRIDGCRGMVMVRKNFEYHHLRAVANVFAKELVLSGKRRVRTTSLSGVLDAIEYENDWRLDSLQGYTVIKEFYVEGAESPFTRRLLHTVESRILHLMDTGSVFTLAASTTKHPEGWGWYSKGFLKTLSTQMLTVEI